MVGRRKVEQEEIRPEVMATCPRCQEGEHSKCEIFKKCHCLCEFYDHALHSKKTVSIKRGN